MRLTQPDTRLALPVRGAVVTAGRPQVDAPPRSWSLAALAGRLTELSSPGGAAALTLAFSIVLDAQRTGEPVGWLTNDESVFFPPDAARGGIDLDALVVVRLSAAGQIPRAAEHLARSGAFGLLVLDLGDTTHVPVGILMRLLGLAKKHESALLFLTRKQRETVSLGSLVSLRAEARREPVGSGGAGGQRPRNRRQHLHVYRPDPQGQTLRPRVDARRGVSWTGWLVLTFRPCPSSC